MTDDVPQETPARPPLHLRFAAKSDVGRVRKDNQDSGYAGPHLLVIADGVGGSVRGDVASSATVDELKRLDTAPGNEAVEALAGAVHRSHDRLREIVGEHPELDGTSTTVSAGIFNGTHLGVVHVGDSRGYLLRDGQLSALTSDHTLVQGLIDEGRITEDEARVHPHRNLILRAVDAVHEPEPDVDNVELQEGDRILFCSDGCSGFIGHDLLTSLLAHGDVETSADRLVSSALDAGSNDNVTVIVADVTAGPAPDPEPAPLVVGAAARAPHLALGRDHTGNLAPEDLADLRDGDGAVDEEELRYAPRAPRRFIWVRRVVVLALVLALIAAGAVYLYGVTQKQYYVARSGASVAIFKGVQADLPAVRLHSVYESTDIEMTDLPVSYQDQVRAGISADSLAAARRIVENLRTFAVCGDNAPTPTPTPSPRRTRKPTRKPTARSTATTTPRPTRAATRTPTSSPTGSPTGSAGSTTSTDCESTP